MFSGAKENPDLENTLVAAEIDNETVVFRIFGKDTWTEIPFMTPTGGYGRQKALHQSQRGHKSHRGLDQCRRVNLLVAITGEVIIGRQEAEELKHLRASTGKNDGRGSSTTRDTNYSQYAPADDCGRNYPLRNLLS